MSRRNEHLYNITRNCYRKSSQVIPNIGITLRWVIEGISFEEMTLSEVLEIRERGRWIGAGLEPCEVHGCKYIGPRAKEGYELVIQARQFYTHAIA